MSVMQQMIEKAEQMEAAEQVALDAERAEAQRREAAEIAGRRAKLIEWLGPLADEMTVSEGQWSGRGTREITYFLLTPHAWTWSDACIHVTADIRERTYLLAVSINGETQAGAACRTISATNDQIARFLLRAQRMHDAGLAGEFKAPF